jgi:hypothetical protein
MSERRSCYVLMPFASEFDVVYELISRAAEQNDLDCARADKKKDLGLINQGIIIDILCADVIVADISALNPNVLYELGIAHTLNKPTIILSQELAAKRSLPFDITNMATTAYELPTRASDRRGQALLNKLYRQFGAHRIHHNPVTITLNAERLRLANHFGHPFLWGFAKTLRESATAKEAWIVSGKLYWERLNGTFYDRIFEGRIMRGERLEMVLMPDSDENRHRRTTFLDRYRGINPNVEEYLRILLTEDSRAFAFLPTEISIYDPRTHDIRAVMLEPMALEGVDCENDTKIARAIDDDLPRDLLLHNLREETFDIGLAKITAERLSVAFKRIWNEECLKRENKAWII